MKYTFVGLHPETLASGRPLVFGDTVDSDVLSQADARLAPLLVEPASAPAPEPAPEPEPSTPESEAK
jgi:hypothetical protein